MVRSYRISISGVDYVNTPPSAAATTFSPNDNILPIVIEILDDSDPEQMESFELVLAIPSDPPSGLGLSLDGLDITRVVILDDESE